MTSFVVTQISQCPKCDGTGRDYQPEQWECVVCRGTGSVRAEIPLIDAFVLLLADKETRQQIVNALAEPDA